MDHYLNQPKRKKKLAALHIFTTSNQFIGLDGFHRGNIKVSVFLNDVNQPGVGVQAHDLSLDLVTMVKFLEFDFDLLIKGIYLPLIV